MRVMSTCGWWQVRRAPAGRRAELILAQARDLTQQLLLPNKIQVTEGEPGFVKVTKSGITAPDYIVRQLKAAPRSFDDIANELSFDVRTNAARDICDQMRQSLNRLGG